MKKNAIPLTNISPHIKAVVMSIDGGQGLYHRLSSMGINFGSIIEVLCTSGANGPVLVASGESRIAIGHKMAEKIKVIYS